jgi:hypothetical protein
VVGATDRRVKCVACQVPLVSGHDNFRALVRADFIPVFRAQFEADRLARYRGEAPAMAPVVDEDPLAPSALPTPDSWTWFTQTHASRAPAWRNEVTLRSVELFTEYEPGTYLPWISPTPLLMCVAEHDVLTPAELAIAAFAARERAEAARDPAGRALRRLRGRLRRRGRRGDGLVHRAPARAQRARRRAVLASGRDGRRRRLTRRPRARGEHPGRGQWPAGVRRAGACGRT